MSDLNANTRKKPVRQPCQYHRCGKPSTHQLTWYYADRVMTTKLTCSEHTIREKYWEHTADYQVALILGVNMNPRKASPLAVLIGDPLDEVFIEEPREEIETPA
jgi:hypothetical protein